MVALTDDGPFVFGVCAFCEAGLPAGKRPSQPRVICDQPECRSAASAYGQRRSILIQRRRREQVTAKVCARCPTGTPAKPLTREHFYVDKRDAAGNVIRWSRWCKPCKRAYAAAKRAEGGKPWTAAYEREKARMAADPEYAEHVRVRRRRAVRAWRVRDPEGYREANRRHRERVKADPARLRRKREMERMSRRLKREREGGTLASVRAIRSATDESAAPLPMLPALPLGEAVDRMIRRELAAFDVPGGATDGQVPPGATRESLALGYGTTDRTLRAWLSGERQSVAMVDADRIMVATGLLAFDIWSDPAVLALWES